jgi:putative transposase
MRQATPGAVTRRFNNRREDPEVLPLIQAVMKERPSYGYKRITAMVNKRFERKYNRKRVYRLMRKAGLLLPKHPARRDEHAGTGQVMVPKSNMRWCSDCFEIRCWNDERVYVAFAMDCCDREVIHFIASKEDILSDGIQQLMIQAVERRFRRPRTTRPVQWLSDRGSIYKSKHTQEFATSIGLKPCFTAAYSPASNGMAEALVASFKRDYVYVNDCETADWVLAQLPTWFRDYNEVAPHSALAMRSPREFRRGLKLAG